MPNNEEQMLDISFSISYGGHLPLAILLIIQACPDKSLSKQSAE